MHRIEHPFNEMPTKNVISNNTNSINRKTKQFMSSLLAVLSGGILLAFPFIDKFYLRTGFLEESTPDFSSVQILRTIIVLISLSVLIFSLVSLTSPRYFVSELIENQFEKVLLIAAVFFAVLFVAIFLIDSKTFSNLSMEDGLIEWSSMIFSLCGSFIFLYSFIKARKNKNIQLIFKGIFLLFTISLFLIAMEEISWFQRILRFQTPNDFYHNAQNEFNFHNFATNVLENVYYFGAFLFLAVLPLTWRIFGDGPSSSYLKLFIPKPYITIICSIACAFNYDMWNILFTQISFFGSIIILFVFYTYNRENHKKAVLLFVIILSIGNQIIFLLKGDWFIRPWDVTEYKEFFIPMAFFGYSIDVYRNTNKITFLN